MIKVSIVEDDKIIRQSLHLIIDGTEGLKCLAEYERCESLLQEIKEKKPDVILMDIHLKGGMSGIEATREVRKTFPEIVILMQTIYEEDHKIFDALCAGANGYLLKKTSPTKLIEAIKDGVEGGAPMSPAIAKKVVEYFKQSPRKTDDAHLSDREIEVLKLIADGKPYKAAADHLAISVPTIRFHMGNIYKKLHATSQSEAVAKAMRKGIL